MTETIPFRNIRGGRFRRWDEIVIIKHIPEYGGQMFKNLFLGQVVLQIIGMSGQSPLPNKQRLKSDDYNSNN